MTAYLNDTKHRNYFVILVYNDCLKGEGPIWQLRLFFYILNTNKKAAKQLIRRTFSRNCLSQMTFDRNCIRGCWCWCCCYGFLLLVLIMLWLLEVFLLYICCPLWVSVLNISFVVADNLSTKNKEFCADLYL